jgi:cytoskeletal protein CcmA (bactofilin family)
MDPVLQGVELTALLGRGTRFEGKLYFAGRVRIDGEFHGEIKSDDVLVIGEGADVSAEIDAGTVIVRGGTVRGNVRARDAIELYVPANVLGNLRSPSIFIDKGVKIEGSCVMAPVDGDVTPAASDPSSAHDA